MLTWQSRKCQRRGWPAHKAVCAANCARRASLPVPARQTDAAIDLKDWMLFHHDRIAAVLVQSSVMSSAYASAILPAR